MSRAGGALLAFTFCTGTIITAWAGLHHALPHGQSCISITQPVSRCCFIGAGIISHAVQGRNDSSTSGAQSSSVAASSGEQGSASMEIKADKDCPLLQNPKQARSRRGPCAGALTCF